ncbi:zinc-binding dehydrogenase [Pendulispora albinea]|uniref:Zinc-binding dehydrogenase n=1 Tax=Pendulispora albinea TaxID=2741071 RepID=A0ABZ2MAS6_9BACT
MTGYRTEAWVLRRGDGTKTLGPLLRETITISPLSPQEVLIRPIYGCWEGNMDHAVRRSPVDICTLRGEDAVVIGNAGVVQVVEVGSAVTTVRPGDRCIAFCNGTWDAYGYTMRAFGYDDPGTVGVLAKTTKFHERQLVTIPQSSQSPRSPHDARRELRQWAGFSLRYVTAWANWRVALACWRSQMAECPPSDAFVCAWGGGVSLAELVLAKSMGFKVAMIASTPSRLALLNELGIAPIDRSAWPEGHFEKEFLKIVDEKSGGRGVDIFVDNLGVSYKTTLKSLARQGVVTTSGWKHGMTLAYSRAMECIGRHIHVHTHYARYEEGKDSVRYASENDWLPPADDAVTAWEQIPELAEAYAQGHVDSYFPIFAVNEDLA